MQEVKRIWRKERITAKKKDERRRRRSRRINSYHRNEKDRERIEVQRELARAPILRSINEFDSNKTREETSLICNLNYDNDQVRPFVSHYL